MSLQEQFVKLQQKLRPLNLYLLNGNTLVDAELKAYAAGLNILATKLETLEKEAFVATAESYGLAFRERLSGRIKDSVDINDRRAMLNYRNSITANDFTKADIERALLACGIEAKIDEHFNGESIYVQCVNLLDEFESRDEVLAAAEEFLPAHLEVIFDFRSFCWDDIDALLNTFDYMDSKALSWDEIDVYNSVI